MKPLFLVIFRVNDFRLKPDNAARFPCEFQSESLIRRVVYVIHIKFNKYLVGPVCFQWIVCKYDLRSERDIPEDKRRKHFVGQWMAPLPVPVLVTGNGWDILFDELYSISVSFCFKIWKIKDKNYGPEMIFVF